MSKKTTRNALFTSLMSLLLCASMLVGTTFAWFTDSVTSSGNIIKSGVLDVEMTWAETNSANEADWKDASTGAIFDYQLWEPGFTQTRYVKIANVGNLDFKYKLTIVPAFTPAAGEANLADVIDAYLVPVGNAPADRVEADAIIASGNGTSLTNLIADPDGAAYGTMLDGTSETYCIILHMQEEADNRYQGLSVGDGFSVHLLATQLASEVDSFGPDYDNESVYDALPAAGAVQVVAGQTADYEVLIKAADDRSGNTNVKVATATVPAAAVADGAEQISITIEEAPANITVAADQAVKGYEITATGLKAGNTEDIEVFWNVGTGLTGVELYHNGVKVSGTTYNPATGILRFVTKGFSPFAVVYDAEPVAAPDAKPEDLPVASVTAYNDTADIVWGNYGQWSPTEGLEANLEAAYVFKCPETGDEANEGPYAQWHCDFYVKLDRDLAPNQIFLGGNYGDFGWIGFHNGDITLAANEEIGLLSSVTNNPWTYADIANFVGEFICGVGDVNNALSGATFTVMLRLTNPNDASEYYNVNTVEYTFA